jgi:hypothetical protein
MIRWYYAIIGTLLCLLVAVQVQATPTPSALPTPRYHVVNQSSYITSDEVIRIGQALQQQEAVNILAYGCDGAGSGDIVLTDNNTGTVSYAGHSDLTCIRFDGTSAWGCSGGSPGWSWVNVYKCLNTPDVGSLEHCVETVACHEHTIYCGKENNCVATKWRFWQPNEVGQADCALDSPIGVCDDERCLAFVNGLPYGFLKSGFIH